jgi:hypothetical protein
MQIQFICGTVSHKKNKKNTRRLPIHASVHEMALRATAGLDWKCAHNWGIHPLTSHRVEGLQSERVTRQATSRSFLHQHELTSLVSRLINT